MKRTKKRDKILLDHTVNKAMQSIADSCGILSVMTTKLLIKQLQATLKNRTLPEVPAWYKSSSSYYDRSHEEIITAEEFKQFQTKQEK